MLGVYEQLFNVKPKEYSSPLDKNDHPELDDSDLLSPEDSKKYLSLIGAMQWAISLGRFDIFSAVTTLSRFRIEPRVGHLERIKRVYGYLRKFKHAAIRIRTGLPDYSSLDKITYDWAYTTYGNVKEELPRDAPEPLGNPVITTTYVDANLYHDLVSGRALSGILHLVNGTPVEWFSKRQATVETATYSSEFVAARTATEQIIDLRNTLRYLGIPVHGPSYMFGDNKSVVTSSTIPHSVLSKRHNCLAYHRVREAIAADIVRFHHIEGTTNPADVLSKHCGYTHAWPVIRPLLFWSGDTSLVPDSGNREASVCDRGECQDYNSYGSRDVTSIPNSTQNYPRIVDNTVTRRHTFFKSDVEPTNAGSQDDDITSTEGQSCMDFSYNAHYLSTGGMPSEARQVHNKKRATARRHFAMKALTI